MSTKEEWDARFTTLKKAFNWAIRQLESGNFEMLEEKKEKPTKKRERSPEPAKDKEEPAAAEGDEEFECQGQLWLDPPGPCVDKKNKHIKAAIKFGKTTHVVCKDCKNAKANYLKKQKKAAEKKTDE